MINVLHHHLLNLSSELKKVSSSEGLSACLKMQLKRVAAFFSTGTLRVAVAKPERPSNRKAKKEGLTETSVLRLQRPPIFGKGMERAEARG